jgi:amidase
MNIELCYLSAVEAIERFKARTLSPVELLEALIQRAEQVEPKINAFSFEYFDEALAAARQAEQRYRQENARPLEGIPVAIKDESYIKGQKTTNGSLLLQDYVAETTSITVERLLEAGAIVHARTTTPEFSISAITVSRLWGATRNPWNLDMTCGGSSGGSGAALAAGATTLANGSDIAGSIRIPASLCGVVGYKAPYGRNPEDSPFNLDAYNHPGPLARSVADCILMQNVMAGPHPRDMASLKPKLVLPTRFDGIRDWRIAYSIDLGYQPVEPEVRDRTLAALDVFRSLGATVEEVDLGWTEQSLTATLDYLGYGLMGAYLKPYYESSREQLTGYVRAFTEYALQVSSQDYYQAEVIANEMYASLSAVFSRYNVFICPTIANTGVKADFDYSVDDVAINGVSVNPKFGWLMTYPFNMLSRCPVLTVPAGYASNGVPCGIQIVGPTYEDSLVFQAAAAYEAAAASEAVRPPFCSATNFPAL